MSRFNQKWQTGANVLFALCLSLALLVMLNYLASRHYKRFDLTAQKEFSLSPKTIGILEKLAEPLELIVFYDPTHPLYSRIKTLLEQYSEKTDLFNVSYIDPARDVARARQFVEKYQVETADVLIVHYQGRTKHVSAKEMAEYDYSPVYSGGAPQMKAFRGEQALSAAILNVQSQEQQTVHFSLGHGEKSIEDFGEEGFAKAAQYVREDNFIAKEINFLFLESLPEDLSTLVIAGPKKEWNSQELSLLEQFLKNSGRLMLLQDPFEYSGLEPLLEQYGIVIGNNVVVDPARKLPFVSPANLFVMDYPNHAITKSMGNVASLFPLVRSVSLREMEGFEAQSFVQTSVNGWGEVNYDVSPFSYNPEKDLQGPVSLAVAVQAKQGSGRIVVFGDSDFMINSQTANPGNADLFRNALNWLTEQEDLLAISPKVPEYLKLQMSRSQYLTLVLLFILGIPLFWAVLGVFVYRKRRR